MDTYRWLMRGVVVAVSVLESSWAGAAGESASQSLVVEGKAAAVIVIPFEPNTAAHWAAKELQEHVRLITGVELKIVHEREDVEAGLTRIAVGESGLTRTAGYRSADLGKQEYVHAFKPGLIVVLGKDKEPDPWPYELRGKYASEAKGAFGRGWGRGAAIGIRNHGFNNDAGSVEIWIRKDSNGNLWKCTAWNGGHDVGASVRRGVIEYSTTVGEDVQKLEAPMVTDEGWHLLTLTWDAASGKKQILVDGVLATEGVYRKTECSEGDYFALGGNVGSEGAGGGWSWQAVDEFRLSRVVRTYPNGVPQVPFEEDESTCLLLHFDDEGGPRYAGHRFDGRMPNGNDPIATCYAVYDFLERYCGVRWYFPTDLGRVYPKTNTLVVSSGQDVTRKPWLPSRSATGFGISEEGWGGRMNNFLYNQAQGDDPNLFAMRMRMGGWRINFNHSFYGYYDRYWEKNPEKPDAFVERHEDWFARGAKGNDPWQGGKPPQLCYTSTGLIAQVIADAKNHFSGGNECFGVVPMDNPFQCQCENCIKLLVPEAEKAKEFSSGNSSELIWYFTEQIAKGTLADHPGNFIGQLSYFDYFAPPKQTTLSRNVIAGPCMGLATCDSLDPKFNHEMRMYNDWVKMKQKTGMILSMWIYQCFPNETGGTRGFRNFPGFHAHKLQKYMTMLNRDKIDGVFLCGVSSHIDGYLTLKLMDDAALDVDKTMDEFFSLFYGKAGPALQKFYLAIEASFAEQGAGGTIQESYDRRGMKNLLKSCSAWMDEAKAAAETDAEKKRVSLFEQGVWNHIQEGYNQYIAKCGGVDPYPLSYVAETHPTGRVDGVFGNALAIGGVFGPWDHGFNDDAGTIEFWVEVGSGGTFVEINSVEPRTGHSIGRKSYIDEKSGEKKYDQFSYRTWVGGATNEIVTGGIGAGWHHIMAVWSAKDGKKRLTVDGKVVATGDYKKTSCSLARKIAIGGGIDSDKLGSAISWGWGKIDEVRVSRVVRKAARQAAPWTGDKDTLLLLHFDEENGEYPTESSGRDWSVATKRTTKGSTGDVGGEADPRRQDDNPNP